MSDRLIQLSSRTNLDWHGQLVDETHIDTLIEDECRVLKPDGSLLLHLRKKVLGSNEIASAWDVLKKLNFKTTSRWAASGIPLANKIKMNGEVSNTKALPSKHGVKSFILGYFDRSPRFPFCRPCAWNQENPEKFEKLMPLVRQADKIFQETVPDRYAVQREMADQTNDDFKLKGTAFTTLTVNKNFRTACHKDAGDLAEGFGVITCIRSGRFRGGVLVLPDFRVGVKFDTGDILFFDVHEFHGNTAIKAVSEDFTRCTIVFYYRNKMRYCLSAAEEAERAKSRQPGESLTEDFASDSE